MHRAVNTYIALLAITVVGAGAASLIIKVANENAHTSVSRSAEYAALQQEILSQ